MAADCNLFVFTDLDDSLFCSKRKHIKSENSKIASLSDNGETESYSSIQQQKLIEIFSLAKATFIPVTGRRSSSYHHCILSVIKESKYAIVSHGALILEDNSSLLPCWMRYLDDHYDMALWAKRLSDVYLRLTKYFSSLSCEARVRLIVDYNISTYICIKISTAFHTSELLNDINTYLNKLHSEGFKIHSNEGCFAVLPPYASKELAVNFMKIKLNISQHDIVFGIGDSVSDIPFIRSSDFAIFPKSSQILKVTYND